MPVLTPERLADLQTATQASFEKIRFTEIATDLREYHVFPNLVLFKDEKGASSRMETRDAGTKIEYKAMVQHSGASRVTGMNAVDDPVKVNVLQTATIPWRHTTTQWGQLQQELAMNSSQPEQIVDIELATDKAALISLAVLMENQFWGAPLDSSDETSTYSIFTWFPKSASTGFVGAFPSGFTTLGLASEHARWKHYVDAYANLTTDDAFYKLWLMMLRTKFKNPVAGIPNLDNGMDRGVYMNTPTYVAFAQGATRQNDNVGYDLAKAQGITLFMNNPLMIVPKLDADTTDPICQLDWGTLKYIALKGWWLRRLTIKNYPGQHLTDAKFIDSTFNLACWNRRKNGIMAKGTTYPS